MKQPIFHYIAEKPTWASQIATDVFSISREQFNELVPRGAVYLNKKRLKSDVLLAPKDYLRIHPQPKRFASLDDTWRESILFEDEDFLVYRKPAGMPVHASLDNAVENVLTQLSARLKYSLFITHRLDVPVEGCLVFAKSPEAQTRFNQALIKNHVEKFYRCLIERELKPSVLCHYMEKSKSVPKKLSHHEQPGWQKCELEILSCRPVGRYQELTLKLMTGRTHQIRAQLAAVYAPILGDALYGGSEKEGFFEQRIALQAFRLHFAGTFSLELPSPWASQ